MTEKIIKKSYPRRGVKVKLKEYYHRDLCPRRGWKLWVEFKDFDRTLEIHGILTDKETAINFYNFVCKKFSLKKLKQKHGGK